MQKSSPAHLHPTWCSPGDSLPRWGDYPQGFIFGGGMWAKKECGPFNLKAPKNTNAINESGRKDLWRGERRKGAGATQSRTRSALR